IPAPIRKKYSPVPQVPHALWYRWEGYFQVLDKLSLTAWSCHHAMSRYHSLFGCAFHSRRALHRRTCGGAQKQCQRTVSADRLSRGHTASGNDVVDQSEASELRSPAGAACAF